MPKVYQIENHDEAYQIWKNNGVQNAVLVHIDAHKDFINDKCDYITIGNFLNYALDDEIINSIVWIVPDPSFLRLDILDQLIEEMKLGFTLDYQSEEMMKFVAKENRNIEIIITMLPNINCLLETSLSKDNILIDIDIDYFVNPYVNSVYSSHYPNSFWTRSEVVYLAMEPLVSKCSIITIARSIYGGYTPIIYHFISNQLYEMFMNNDVKEYSGLERAIDLLNVHKNEEAAKLFEEVLNNSNCYLSAIVGSVYSNLLSGNTDKAKKYFNVLFTQYPQYEPYFFAVHPKLISGLLVEAEQLIDDWLSISNKSVQANLYKIKVISCSPVYNADLQVYLDNINDEKTNYEMSYVLAEYYLKMQLYDKSIECCEKVLAYLKQNNSPLWVGQISSYELRKNHGTIVAFLFEKIAIAYYKLHDFKRAKKYAITCMKIGYFNENIEKLGKLN